MSPRTVAVLFTRAGIGLAACDLMHVKAGVLRHRARGPFGQAWWVAPVFGCAGVTIAVAARPFVRERHDRVAATAVPFAAAYAATALVSLHHPRWLTAALWATGLARARHDLPFALLLAAAGPAVEVGVARAGHFAYARPDSEVLPWLAGLYVHGAPLALAVSSRRSGSGAARG